MILEKFTFFKEAVKSIKTSGSLIPSSKFLVKRILNKVDFSTSELIIEFGAGNGVITKEILKQLKPSAKLICFEINEAFYCNLKKIDHKQLIVLNISAQNIAQEIEKTEIKQADYIISSLPLSILPKKLSTEIIKNSIKVLPKNGCFIQYQYSLQFLKQFKSLFKNKVALDFEPLNIPPAFVYTCKK